MTRLDPINCAIWGGLFAAIIGFWSWVAVTLLPTGAPSIIVLAALTAAAAALKGERA